MCVWLWGPDQIPLREPPVRGNHSIPVPGEPHARILPLHYYYFAPCATPTIPHPFSSHRISCPSPLFLRPQSPPSAPCPPALPCAREADRRYPVRGRLLMLFLWTVSRARSLDGRILSHPLSHAWPRRGCPFRGMAVRRAGPLFKKAARRRSRSDCPTLAAAPPRHATTLPPTA